MVLLKRGEQQLLDSHLEACQEDAATKLQAVARGHLTKKKEGEEIKLKLWAALKMQTMIRSYRARKQVAQMGDEKAEAAQQLRLQQEEHDLLEREVEEEDAVELMQRAWRGFKGRDAASAKKKAVTLIQSAWRRSDTSARIGYLRAKFLTFVITTQRHIRGHLARARTKREAIQNQAACIVQECYLRHLARRHTAAAQIQAWWRKMLADLAIHWVLRQFRRSVFITQFAYSSMKAKTLAEEYSKYQASVDQLNNQFGSQQIMAERDLVAGKFEEQLKRGVDAAYRNEDEAEIERVISFGEQEEIPGLVEYAADALFNLRQQPKSIQSSPNAVSISPSAARRKAPPPPNSSPPVRSKRTPGSGRR